MADERHTYCEKTPWWNEHVFRYVEAIKQMKSNGIVLDIACGNGYGTTLLAGNQQKAIGGDLSEEAVKQCKEQFGDQKNVDFQVLDGTALSFDNTYFDYVISYETIEHTTEYKKMLAEFNRVLKVGGTALISTPNILVNSPSGQVTNPFHTQEFTYEELDALLKGAFDEVIIYGQHYSRHDNTSFLYRVAHAFEKLFYLRGFRKIPMKIQDMIMNSLIHKTMYPELSDFSLVSDVQEIKKCLTFFAVCKKKK